MIMDPRYRASLVVLKLKEPKEEPTSLRSARRNLPLCGTEAFFCDTTLVLVVVLMGSRTGRVVTWIFFFLWNMVDIMIAG